jgi:murein DD-endopeptidase MepM/ murein hydrolase activator NlpD|tara:strand:+ start:1703 stop:3064 length:1362 start_codon:yes stop_codon:yes gene_type:complete
MIATLMQKATGFLHLILNVFPRRHLIAASVVSCCLLILIVYPVTDAEANRRISEQLVLPTEPVTANITPEAIPTPTLRWVEQSVGTGDSLSLLFSRAGLSAADVYKVSSSIDGKLLRNLYPGEFFRFGLNKTGELEELHYIQSKLVSRVYSLEGDSYSSELRELEPDTLLSYREGIINDSLYLSAQQANLPDKLIMELANIFAWDIDFVFDIRQGDSFAILFQEKYLDGEKFGVGDIVAASFTNRGKSYNAVRYTDSQGHSSYYTPEGLSMRKAFLRAPLDIFRISSGFNLRRKHPIHKMIKAHRGVDYAAPRGTPVFSAGDGKVIATGYSKANGNYVFVQHGQTYVTKYLHLNKKKVRKGQTVKQRQTIGTVGSTGYATGPHLHYEFLVNGVHRNPRTVKLPQANPISATELAAFKLATTPVLTQLAQAGSSSEFVQVEPLPSGQIGIASAN